MQDLSAQYDIALAPSSMSGGNTVSDDPALAMTAPGSQSVNNIPDRKDVLPQPQLPSQIPVSNAPRKPHPAAAGWPGSWAQPAGSGSWKQSGG